MKNLLIYLNPRNGFDNEHARYAKIQIDNSLNYWRPEDILMVTNFPFEHHGIKALEVPDKLFCEFDAKASKINAIIYLLEHKILVEPTWFHDFEAFQVSPFELKLDHDLCLTDYGWKPKWNTGVFFFKPEALDIFHWLQDGMNKYQGNEEPVLWILWKQNFNNIRSRCQKLNITYDIGMRNVEYNLSIADKPIKVLHFHPYRHNLFERFKPILPGNLAILIDKYKPAI
jgi:hypothetical protein